MAGRSQPGDRLNGRLVRVFEAIAIGVGLSLVIAGGTQWSKIGVSHAWATEAAPAQHEKTEGRLTHLERPELLIQLSQAGDAVHKVEEAHRIAIENRATIRLIESEQRHTREDVKRNEGHLIKILDKIDKLAESAR